jgi:uncharacterized membrane protein YhhN
MPAIPAALTVACLLSVAALVLAELRQRRGLKRLYKVSASSAFVLVAFSLHATDSVYGQAVLAALVLSWIGDVCLLSERSTLFLSGLACFLLAHIAYSIAFAAGALHVPAGVAGFVLMSIVGARVLHWLWHRLGTSFKAAVSAYVAAIVAMCALAIAYGTASGSWLVVAGALAFAASDISVARDRFVAPGFANKAWGLPTYYSAQLLLAWSIRP